MTRGAAAAQVFRTTEVARILSVSPIRVRTMVRAGLCRPGRHGRAFEFSFQDLVLLRAAQGLSKAGVPPRRVKTAMSQLTRALPSDRPLSGIRIFADGRRVAVREGHRAWQPESGQQLFVFDVDDLAERSGAVLSAMKQKTSDATSMRVAQSATAWFDRGVSLENDDPDGAREAYQRAIDIDPEMSDAYVNLGRLLHDAGDLDEALRCYRRALESAPDDPVVHYNFALVLEDAGDMSAARMHYHEAVEIDPNFADAHFNLGRLLERIGRRSQALRHLLAYRRLTEK
jgi:tetratricopeptide (TPR) repeat protein